MSKIIDAHLHIFKYREHWSEWAAKRWIEEMPNPHYWYTNKDLVPEDFNSEYDWAAEVLNESGVDGAILLGNWQSPHGIKVPTSYLMEAVTKYPNFFYAFAAPDPLGGWDSVKELEQAYSLPGFFGLKLLPTYNYASPLDRRIWPLYELTAAAGKRIIIHTGFGPVPENRLAWQEPYALEELLIAFPNLKICMGHTGFHRFMDAVCLMSKNRQLYGDLAYWHHLPIDYITRSLVFAKSLGVLDRIMWGTDFPHIDPAADLAKFRRIPEYSRVNNIEPYISDEELDGILGGNAIRFLGLEVEN